MMLVAINPAARRAWLMLAHAALVALVVVVTVGCDGERPSHETRVSEPPASEPLSAESQPRPSGSSDAPDGARGQKDTAPKIVAFGDSLTAGFGVAPQASYPVQLQRRLDDHGYRYEVINAGVSGDTTAGGLRRIPWILNSHPYLVVLELGGNDGLRGLDLDQTRSNLEAIIVRLQQAGILTVLAGMKLPPNYGAEYTARFESMYRDLATRYQLPLIPFFLDGVGGDRRLNQADGIHPTGEGYQIVADTVFRALTPFLEQSPTRRTNAAAAKDRSAPIRPAGGTDRR
jgi:acyl-CoA thioesterase-1